MTPVPGKGPLVQGTDYSLVYSGATCELTLNTLTAASVIGPGERLIIAYRTQLDAGTQNGITLTNVAGATQWYNDASNESEPSAFTRTLTDGTVGHPGLPGCAHASTVSFSGYFFEKTAAISSRRHVARHRGAGDMLRYTIRIHRRRREPITNRRATRLDAREHDVLRDRCTLTAQPVSRPRRRSTLVAGVDVSSSNLTPPMPGPGAGDLSGGQMAVVQFDLRVTTARRTARSSRTRPSSIGRDAGLLSDDDGNRPATGPEPTVVVRR